MNNDTTPSFAALVPIILFVLAGAGIAIIAVPPRCGLPVGHAGKRGERRIGRE